MTNESSRQPTTPKHRHLAAVAAALVTVASLWAASPSAASPPSDPPPEWAEELPSDPAPPGTAGMPPADQFIDTAPPPEEGGFGSTGDGAACLGGTYDMYALDIDTYLERFMFVNSGGEAGYDFTVDAASSVSFELHADSTLRMVGVIQFILHAQGVRAAASIDFTNTGSWYADGALLWFSIDDSQINGYVDVLGSRMDLSTFSDLPSNDQSNNPIVTYECYDSPDGDVLMLRVPTGTASTGEPLHAPLLYLLGR